VHVLLLGSAAGGGFPQWNCWCACCQIARSRPLEAWPRTQSSVAISRDGSRWFLLNASPDVRQQLTRLVPNRAPSTVRHTPIEAVLLTDAEIDHSLGIVLLREARRLPLYVTAGIRTVLDRDSHLLPIVRAFAEVPVTELPIDTPVPLHYREGGESGLSAEAFLVPGTPPRFARADTEGHTVGLLVRDPEAGRTCAFVPGCGTLTPALLARFATADVLLFDGTFWSDEEPMAAGIGDRTASQMGHVPIAGAAGSLQQLARLPCRHRVYTHINNTNPVLVEQSQERALVQQAGLTVGFDGWHAVV
jgi:pyrroloquinoline quinone biosynthesis protein B